jgi:hypothetical protein
VIAVSEKLVIVTVVAASGSRIAVM